MAELNDTPTMLRETVRGPLRRRRDAPAGARASCVARPAARARSPTTRPRCFGAGLYARRRARRAPRTALLASLGCGNPTAMADLRAGEIVLDLGSGGGIDVLLSARRVGPTGTAYGLDMTDEMLALARANQAKAGVENVTGSRATSRRSRSPRDRRRRALQLRHQPLHRQAAGPARGRARAQARRPLRRLRRRRRPRHGRRHPRRPAAVRRLHRRRAHPRRVHALPRRRRPHRRSRSPRPTASTSTPARRSSAPASRASRGSPLRSGRRLVVEVEQHVDVRDQRGRVGRADAQEHLATGHQQLVARLQLLGEIRLVHASDGIRLSGALFRRGLGALGRGRCVVAPSALRSRVLWPREQRALTGRTPAARAPGRAQRRARSGDATRG